MQEIKVVSLANNVSLNQLKRIVIDIKKNKIALSPRLKSYTYQKTIWHDHHSRYFLFKLHSLTMISYLLTDYKLFKDDQCVEKAIHLFYLWYEENFPKSYCELCYHPHVIAQRLLVVSNLFSVCKKLDLCILEDLFIEVMSTHAKMLNDDNIYKKQHLDGIDQDIALLTTAIIYNEYYIKNAFYSYIELSIERLNNQLDYYISDDESSFLGQSIENAYRLFLRLNDLLLFLNESIQLESFSKLIKKKQDCLYQFIYTFTQPGGILPPIGDSSYVSINQALFLSYPHPYNLHFKSLFKNSKHLVDRFVYYKKANLLITNGLEYQFIFNNAFYSTNHKHQDNLAFCLSYKGNELFIDGGRYNYQTDNYYRQAIISSYAHNTICVDYNDYQIDKYQINHSGIVNVVLEDDLTYACGIHTLYEAVILKRNILIVSNQLFVIDEMFAKEMHAYEIIFHLNPILKLKSKYNKNYYGFVDNELALSLHPIFSTFELTPHYHYGNQNQYKGFMSRMLNQIEPAHTLIYQGKGENELVVNQISLGGLELPINVKANDKLIQIKVDEDLYTILRGKTYNEITKNNLPLNQKISSYSTLNQAINDFFCSI